MSTTSAGPSMRQSVALVWRTLRSMRTALILLLLMALAAVAGSLIPQWPNSPDRVLQYKAAHGLIGSLYERAGLFDVFGSWWFVLITALLFVSLAACLVPRTRATWRAIRQKPIQAREIDGFKQYEERVVAWDPEATIASAARVLKRRFYRVARDPDRPSLAAEKGAAREVGSLLFHWAFILILVGVIFGKGTGFTGYAVIVDGQTWTDALANYDGQIRAGRFFGNDFTGTQIHLRNFESEYRRTGVPMDFVSHVDLLDTQGNLVRQQDIRVNHPAQFAGLNIYQINWGWAPLLEVRDGGKLLSGIKLTPVLEPAPDGVPAFAMPWHGVLKVTSVKPNLAIEFQLYPDGDAALQSLLQGQPLAMLKARHPFMQVSIWRGPILDLSTNAFDPSLMKKVSSVDVGLHQTVDLATGKVVEPRTSPSGLTLAFPDLSRYTVLQVSRDRGVPIVLLAAILILVGLLPALYSSRRKVWVRVEPAPAGAGSVLKIGGFALQRKPQFEEEFAKLVDGMTKATGGGSAPIEPSDREKVGSR
jgi:cytochrome c biogenesis protein